MSKSSTTPETETKSLSGATSAAIILSAVALVFVFSNVGDGTLHFLFLSFTMPAWIWFLVLLVVGVVIGSLFPWFRPKKKR